MICGNTFSNSFYTYISAGGASSTDQGRAEGIQIYGNDIVNASNCKFLQVGWAEGISVISNNAGGTSLQLNSGGNDSSYALVSTNNSYWSGLLMDGEFGNPISVSYAQGSRYMMTYPYVTNVICYLSDADSNQIPQGAQILVTNANWSSAPIPLFLNTARTRRPVTINYGSAVAFLWTNGMWQLNTLAQGRTDLRVISSQ